jgi:hypothetical protein
MSGSRNVPDQSRPVHARVGGAGRNGRGRKPRREREREREEMKKGVSTLDSSQAFFRRCTGQKKKCIVKRGQG